MERPDLNDYVLRGGEKGAERLKLLASVMWPTTKRLLRRAGLRPGMCCLDASGGSPRYSPHTSKSMVVTKAVARCWLRASMILYHKLAACGASVRSIRSKPNSS